MLKLSFTEKGKNYQQITKKTACKLFCEGKTIYMCPANYRPFNNPWGNAYELNIKSLTNKGERFSPKENFEMLVNLCIHYNCNSEMGYYLRYYAEM